MSFWENRYFNSFFFLDEGLEDLFDFDMFEALLLESAGGRELVLFTKLLLLLSFRFPQFSWNLP